jgi:all-trans-8'-apo-beta-carotenal 15,15'-oxygenase
MLNRRHALMAAAAALLPLPARADEWADAFRAALPANPTLIGYKSAPERLETAALKIDGKWPAELAGTFYRNGPARHDVGTLRYRHWFDGDGMIQAFRMADGKVAHLGRMIETDKYKRERAAGRALERTFGTVTPDLPPPSSAAAVNVANINVISHAGRLLALWEAADAYALDPKTLDTLGPHAWRDDLKGVPFSAHPRIEPDGTMWSFGYLPGADRLVLYHIDKDGALKAAKVLAVPDIGMVHDFVTTERHLVFLLPPVSFSRAKAVSGASFLDCYEWQPERATRILVIDKSSLEIVRRHDVEGCFVFHFGNGFEETDGTIRFDAARHANPKVMTESLRYVMRGESRPSDPVPAMVVRLDPAGGARTELLPGGSSEFPRIDPRLIAQRHRQVWSVLFDGSDGWPSAGIIRRDLETGATDVYRYPAQTTAEEHVYVPRLGGAEGEGWLLGTHLDAMAGVTRLAAFDAMKLASGPIAVASLPYPLPLGLHGSFVPA